MVLGAGIVDTEFEVAGFPYNLQRMRAMSFGSGGKARSETYKTSFLEVDEQVGDEAGVIPTEGALRRWDEGEGVFRGGEQEHGSDTEDGMGGLVDREEQVVREKDEIGEHLCRWWLSGDKR